MSNRSMPVRTLQVNIDTINAQAMGDVPLTQPVGYAYHTNSRREQPGSATVFISTDRDGIWRGTRGELRLNLAPSRRARRLGEAQGPSTSCVSVYPEVLAQVQKGTLPLTTRVGYFFDARTNEPGSVFLRTVRRFDGERAIWNANDHLAFNLVN